MAPGGTAEHAGAQTPHELQWGPRARLPGRQGLRGGSAKKGHFGQTGFGLWPRNVRWSLQCEAVLRQKAPSFCLKAPLRTLNLCSVVLSVEVGVLKKAPVGFTTVVRLVTGR
jgi:hypothetical protein